ncbi:Ectonucleotide pyrophosphatase/phosphodiesterase family member 4 [Danaus plexippus plexippus]|uniref:Ectonucleotide pyrophosphatase/phosphodiesterase family member 4 n=1 Tax=Danaus plexippus plexippus TaxID=278856 RepID=A0A212FCX8_DANPL|nr:carcinine transporter isoform X2 [Danaus plexippus plexippus]OWR51601.1 Ectonucleotide pyrophosphatase/phosphodiesterase family member 4 [Danaus plexippus plexippus]
MESHEKVVEVLGGSRDLDHGQIEMQNTRVNGSRPSKPQLKDLDDLFPYIGEFGWYQRILFLLMIPYSFFFAFVYFSQIFMTIVPEEHWCFVPELANLTVEERRYLSIPMKDDSKYEKCHVYDVDWSKVLDTGVLTPDSNWPVKKCEQQWEYNYTDVPYETIASQLDWVCDRDNYAATAQSVFFCGSIIGGLIFGWVADKFGRVPAILGTNMAGFLAGVGTAFANSFWSFCLCRFLVGLAYDNCFMVMYIVVVEYVGPKWRTFVANMSIAVYFTFAACLLPWIALAVADWKMYTLITSVPLVLAIFTPCVVPESARWLISQGRIDEALKILKKFERINKKKIPDEIFKEFKDTATKIAKAEEEIRNYSFLDLFKTPRLRRHSLLLLVIWMSIAMVFDGHVRNVGSLGLDIFLTFTVATATEFPADVLLTLTLDIVGRRWLAFGSMLLSGIFSFLATTVPHGVPSATLAIIGRFAVNISFNIGMQYAAELLPTVVRAQGLALIHITGYVATILVPYIVYLATISPIIPLLILGTIGIFGGCLCLCLPESLGKDMPQTLQDGENYGKEQKFWDFPCFKRKNQVPVENRY